MRKLILFCIAIFLLAAIRVGAQDDYNTRAKKYIETYRSLAMEEQRISGIPASITLGQGILETEAGTSELMTKANNHFGIKCKNGWEGEIFLHTDDAPNEQFKKYKSAAESYHDHSEHLKRNARYAPLFKIKQTDYASWAKCLKKCGYATNPQYAQKLIKIIEDFKLQEYTYAALENKEQDPNAYEVIPVVYTMPDTDRKVTVTPITSMADSARSIVMHKQEAPPVSQAAVTDSSITIENGLKAFYASKGEELQQYAQKYHVPYPQLLLMNDLRDAPLPFDMNVYLEPKLTTGTHSVHIMTEGETLLMAAQEEGMQMKSLMALNLLNPNEQPVSGTILELQKTAAQKPGVQIKTLPAHTGNAIVTSHEIPAKESSDYIATNQESAKPQIDSVKLPAAQTVQKPAPIPIAPGAPVAIVNKPAPQQAVPHNRGVPFTKPVHKNSWEMTDDEIEAASEKKVAFAKLKAELDKIVYADDSKLSNQNDVTQVPQKMSATANGNKYYTVKKGETAFSIAKKNNITVDQLKKWNHLGTGGVKVGQAIQVKE